MSREIPIDVAIKSQLEEMLLSLGFEDNGTDPRTVVHMVRKFDGGILTVWTHAEHWEGQTHKIVALIDDGTGEDGLGLIAVEDTPGGLELLRKVCQRTISFLEDMQALTKTAATTEEPRL